MKLMELLRGRREDPEARSEQEIALLLERVTSLNPRLRLVSHYKEKLRPSIQLALDHVHGILSSLPGSREASAHAWGSDPYMHAFFATPRDIELTFSRSPDLQQYFRDRPDATDAFAVLGMDMTERHTLGVALEGDVMRAEVPQTNICFSGHRVAIIAHSDAALREEVLRRIFDQFAIEGVARFTSGESRRDVLDREQTLLTTRLRMLERQGTGMRTVVGDNDGTAPISQARELREELAKNEIELSTLAPKVNILDHQLECLIEALSDARTRFRLAHKRLRLSATNVLQLSETDAAREIDLLTASVPGNPPLERSFTLVRFARADMVSSRALLDEAERLL